MNKELKRRLTRVSHGRTEGQVEWYSPARDITVLLPVLISEALKEWDGRTNSEYLNVLNRLGRKESEIERIAVSLAAYLSKDSILNNDSHEEAFRKSGLLDIPVEIRLPMLSTIAEEMLAAFWYAERSATTRKDDEGNYIITQYDPDEVARVARLTTRCLRVPRWKRGIIKKWWKLKDRIKDIFLNKTTKE